MAGVTLFSYIVDCSLRESALLQRFWWRQERRDEEGARLLVTEKARACAAQPVEAAVEEAAEEILEGVMGGYSGGPPMQSFILHPS
jgi:hypothetical protein